MGRYVMVVPSSPQPGRDEAYNLWYDRRHLPELLAVPGIVSARRLAALPDSPDAPPGSYLALYEIEADDPQDVLAELRRRSGSGEVAVSEALDTASARIWLYAVR